MSQTPQKPPTIPVAARWSDADQEWAIGFIDEGGLGQGAFTHWRPDGTLASQYQMKNGQREGLSIRYHSNGEIFEKAYYHLGLINGERTFYRSELPSTESFPSDVSKKVHRIHCEFESGEMLKQKFFNETGREVLSDGEFLPERPRAIPSESLFNSIKRSWEFGNFTREVNTKKLKKDGVWKTWSIAGILASEQCFSKGVLHGKSREYDPVTGKLLKELPFSEGQWHGLVKTFSPAGDLVSEEEFQMGVPAGQREILYQEGELARPGRWQGTGDVLGQNMTGTWSFKPVVDAKPEDVFYFDFGLPSEIDFVGVPIGSDNEMQEQIQAHLSVRNFAAALWLHARASVQKNHRGPLWAFLRAQTFPLSFATSYAKAVAFEKTIEKMATASSDKILFCVCQEIICGAAPEKVLHVASAHFEKTGQNDLAFELLNCALLIAPERGDFHYNAVLLAMGLGLEQSAHTLIQKLGATSLSEMGYLHFYCDINFQKFAFMNPSREFKFADSGFGDVPCAIEQTLESVTSKIKEQMRQLTFIRHWIRAKLTPALRDSDFSWLPTDFSAQLGENLETPPAPSETNLHLLLKARRLQRSLSTLCWSVGMDVIGVPSEIKPRAELSHFLPEAYARIYYVRDLVEGRKSPLPSYVLSGRAVEEWSPHLRHVIEADTEGLTSALQFLVQKSASNEALVEFDFYKKFYADQGSHATPQSAQTGNDDKQSAA